MIATVENGALYERLCQIWDKKSQYVDWGGATYEVFTPRGMDEPVFKETGGEMLYRSVSVETESPAKKSKSKKSNEQSKK